MPELAITPKHSTAADRKTAEPLQSSPSRVEISKRLVLVNSLSSIVMQLLDLSVILWANQFLLAKVSPEEMDLLPVVMGVMAFAPLFSFALTAGLGRYVTEAYARRDEERITEIVSSILPVYVLATALMGATGAVVIWKAGVLLNVRPEFVPQVRGMLLLMFIGLAIQLLRTPYGVGFYVRQRMVLQNLILLAGSIVRITLMLVLLLAVSPSVQWVIVAMVCGTLTTTAITTRVSCRLVPALRFRWRSINRLCLKELVTFSFWSFIRQVAGLARAGLTPIILKTMGQVGDSTAFYVGSMPQRQIDSFLGRIGGAIEPPLIAMHATRQKDRLENAYIRGGRYFLWSSMIVATPLLVFYHEVSELFTHGRYPDTAIVMLILLLVMPFNKANGMLGPIVHATAQPASLARVMLVTNTIVLILTVLAVGWLGLGSVGAALAVGLTTPILHPLLYWPLGRRLSGVGFGRSLREIIWPGLLPAIGSSIVMMALKFGFAPNSWLGLGICATAGIATYGLILFAFSLQPVDRRDLRKVLKSANRVLGRA